MSLEQQIKKLSRAEQHQERQIAKESDITKFLREQLRKEIDGRRYG